MRSFLDHDRPEDSEEEEEGGALAEPSDNAAPTSTQQPPTEPMSPADGPNSASAVLTTPPGSPERQKQRKLTPDSETLSSKTDAASSRASSTKAESSGTGALVSAPAPEGDILDAKPKLKLKIKLPPNASGSSKSASNRANAMASDNQKARHFDRSVTRLMLSGIY